MWYLCQSTMGRFAKLESGFIVPDPSGKFEWSQITPASNSNDCMSKWGEAYNKNSHFFEKGIGADKVEKTDVVYLVGAGSSLRYNYKWLKNVRRGKVVVMNEAASINEIPADYFIATDSLGTAKCEGEHITHRIENGVFMVYASPFYTHSSLIQNRFWFKPGMPTCLNEEFPNFPVVFSPCNVSFSALWWIAKYLQPKVVVLVGMDFGGYITSKGEWDGYASYRPQENKGQDATYMSYLFYHFPLLWFIREMGTLCINATEGGRLIEECWMMRLIEAVDMLNEGKEEENGIFGTPILSSRLNSAEMIKEVYGSINNH